MSLEQKTVAVLFGGKSPEHEVSLNSAYNVVCGLKKTDFKTIVIGINKNGEWFEFSGPLEQIKDGSWERSGWCREVYIKLAGFNRGLFVEDEKGLSPLNVDCAFLALHGVNCEDGAIQGLLQSINIKFVGCDVESSACCMNKITSRILAEHAGIKQPKWVQIKKKDDTSLTDYANLVEQKLCFPVFVKPARNGSSIGISKCSNCSELVKGIEEAFKFDDSLICEEGVFGKEIECAVIGNSNVEACEVLGQIKPKNMFYDYDEKYADCSTTELIVPAELESDVVLKVCELAVKVYETLGCSGFSRVDFFVDGQGDVYFNEVNTLPGFTKISMFPKLWEHSGIKTEDLLLKLIELAL